MEKKARPQTHGHGEGKRKSKCVWCGGEEEPQEAGGMDHAPHNGPRAAGSRPLTASQHHTEYELDRDIVIRDTIVSFNH